MSLHHNLLMQSDELWKMVFAWCTGALNQCFQRRYAVEWNKICHYLHGNFLPENYWQKSMIQTLIFSRHLFYFIFFKYVAYLGLTRWGVCPHSMSHVVNHCWSSLVAIPKKSIYLSVECSSLSVRTWVRQDGPAVFCIATPSVLVRVL